MSDQPGKTGTGATQPKLNPGDEAAPGTPGTGEDICADCGGSGRVKGQECQTCSGTGKVTKAIGGA
ncbi:MAG: hypothetical protein JO264_00665 [Acidisphaera sp.]|nr:hypothetical protein [Acidisphaera sp.]